jgi:hypothetical protein
LEDIMTRHYSIAAAAAAFLCAASLAEAQIITVESKCSSGGTYVEGGTGWGNSAAKSNRTPCAAGSRSSRNAGAYADFIPPIASEGSYDVFLTWGQTTSSNNGPNAEGVQVSIVDDNGTQNFLVNMRGQVSCTSPNYDQLVYIGRGYFKPSLGHKVRVAHTATAQCYNGSMRRYVSADAAVFHFVQPLPTVPTTWSTVKARHS